MKRVGLLAGITALGAVLFLVLHGGSKSEAKPGVVRAPDRAPIASRATVAVPSMAPEVGAAAPVEKPAEAEHANVVGLPDQLEPGYLALEHAAKGCYRGHAAPAPNHPGGADETIESIQLSYRQTSSHGIGRAEDVKVLHGKLTDQALQSCIVDAASAVTWSSNAPDGLIGELQQNVTVGDLMRPDYGLPPESKRSPKPIAPPPPGMAAPLGTQAPEPEDEHPDVVVPDPGPAKQPK